MWDLVEIVSRGEKSLIVLSFSLSGNFFAEKPLITSCMLRSREKIVTTALLDIVATKYSFIDLSMARCVCDKLPIELIRQSKPKTI